MESGPVGYLLQYVFEDSVEDERLLRWFRFVRKEVPKAMEERDLRKVLREMWPKGVDTEEKAAWVIPELLVDSWEALSSDDVLVETFKRMKKVEGSTAQFLEDAQLFLSCRLTTPQPLSSLSNLAHERCFGLTTLMYHVLKAYKVAVLERPPRTPRFLGTLHNCGYLLHSTLYCLKCKTMWCSKHCQEELWSCHAPFYKALLKMKRC
eukprot:TRINITY_DN4265_c0_g1_i1.p1 TRINITY_DN4265_c0_g1~~TRINITY_DN4265_c0_g1_i1.p1  ORF type:complete len:221 (+),score=53.02 TRINITY_DN4265_c0_g1_i1:44-664(+)